MKPELSRPIVADRVGQRAETHLVQANDAERSGLAARLGLPAIHSLSCRFDLRREIGSTLRAEGALRAEVEQICVVTLEPFRSAIADDFSVRFKPEGQVAEVLDLNQPDEIPYDGVIDLGEAAAEQLALNLPPYPRAPWVPEDDDFDDG